MGLGWARLASSGAVPLWETLAESGQLATPVMTFYMSRYRGDPSATLIEYDGGLMTLGYINNTIYSGDINYVNFNSNSEDYWRIPVAGLRADTTAVSIVSAFCAWDAVRINMLLSGDCTRRLQATDLLPMPPLTPVLL